MCSQWHGGLSCKARSPLILRVCERISLHLTVLSCGGFETPQAGPEAARQWLTILHECMLADIFADQGTHVALCSHHLGLTKTVDVPAHVLQVQLFNGSTRMRAPALPRARSLGYVHRRAVCNTVGDMSESHSCGSAIIAEGMSEIVRLREWTISSGMSVGHLPAVWGFVDA